MSEEYKDLLARVILITFAVLFVIVVVGLGVWPLFAVVAGTLLSIYALTWALVRIFG